MCDSCDEYGRVSRRSFLKYMGLGAALAAGPAGLVLPQLAAAAPTIYGTASWGAQAPKEPITMLGARPTKIIVHHTATANSTDYSLAHAQSFARSVQNSHFARGWIDTGQQFTISRGGYILEGRHRSLEALNGGTSHVRGAHCDGQNDVAVGIENEGTYMTVDAPAALYSKLVDMCVHICKQYNLPSSAIYGHRDFNATNCPGDRLYAKLPQLRSDVQAQLGGGTVSWPIVKIGQSGERVKTVQYLLRDRGYSSVTADGIFGSGTEGAVKSFQTSKGLAADGIVGQGTWEALIITVRQGDNREAVRGVQGQLKAKGYSVTVDGIFGSGTDSAVRSFQSSKGLTADGIVGLNTWKQLVQ